MSYSYLKIFKDTISYVPSKILVMFNSLIIVPLFSHILEAKEMSVYFIAIQFLNVLCTCSSDWVTKSVLRFHEHHNIKNTLTDFYSTIFCLTLIAHIIVIGLYFLFKSSIQLHFGVDDATFILSVTLVIPCGIRQLLYQYLRVKNNSFLYTFSIFLYQIIFIILFLIFVRNVSNATSILVAMNIAMFVIDIYILKKIDFNLNFNIGFKKCILFETIHYASPLVLINICYWLLLHFSKMYFQNMSMFLYTSILGFSLMLVYNVIQPVGSVFLFAGFPDLVSKYVHNLPIKSYWTRLIQLYVMFMIPLTLVFCFYFKEISSLVFPKEYFVGALVLPFFAFAVFIHELLKLVNCKYHLKNKTYVEMGMALITVPLAILINIFLINKYALIGAAVALCVSELILLIFNSLVNFKNFEYLNYIKIVRSVFITSVIGIAVYFALNIVYTFFNFVGYDNKLVCIAKLLIFVVAYYVIYMLGKNKILSE